MVIAGFFSGIGGGLVYIGGTGRAFTTAEVTLPEGFNGIPVALLGMNSPLGCILAALFVSYINVVETICKHVIFQLKLLMSFQRLLFTLVHLLLMIRFIFTKIMKRKNIKKDKIYFNRHS